MSSARMAFWASVVSPVYRAGAGGPRKPGPVASHGPQSPWPLPASTRAAWHLTLKFSGFSDIPLLKGLSERKALVRSNTQLYLGRKTSPRSGELFLSQSASQLMAERGPNSRGFLPDGASQLRQHCSWAGGQAHCKAPAPSLPGLGAVLGRRHTLRPEETGLAIGVPGPLGHIATIIMPFGATWKPL